MLITLLHTLMFGQVPYQQQQSLLSTNNVNQHHQQGTMMMIPRTKNQAQGGDPALQIMGMLISLITDGGFTNILVGNEVNEFLVSNPTLSIGLPTPSIGLGGSSVGGDSSNDILCKKMIQELSSDSIESFVAAGGLRWACGSIVRLVHMLIHGPNGGVGMSGDGNIGSSGSATNNFMQHGHNSDSDGNNSTHNSSNVDQSMEDITSRTIQTRLMLLIDLVYRLVLYGSVPAAVDNLSLSVTSTLGGDDNDSGGDGGDKKSSSSKKDVPSRSAKKKLIKSAIQSREQELLELLARTEGSSSGNNPYSRAGGGGETSRTSSLRQSLRAPPLAGTSRAERKRALSSSSRLSGGGGSLANLPSGGGGGGGGDNGPSSAVLDENRRRKDRRRATLERVHKLFWSSTLPAAVCVPPTSDTSTVHDESSTMAFGELTPLACLISAYEILRSRPTSHPTLSTNTSLRTFDKGIAILGRIIDAGANNPVVVVDGELPWGLASILSDDNKKTSSLDHVKESKKRKRGRSSSHDGHHHRSSRSSSTVRSARRGSASAASSGDNSPARRAKRSRASGNVASLLERLQGDAAAASSRSGGGGSTSG